MPDKDYAQLPLSFEKGLNEQVEESMLPVGAVSRLRNWEPSPSGEVRARTAWTKGSTTGAPSSRRGRGIGHVAVPQTPRRVQAVAIGSATTSSNTTLNASATWPSATTSGSLLVMCVAFQTGAVTPAVSTPAGWTLAKSTITTQGGSAIFYKENAASESGSVSVTVTASGSGLISIGVTLAEYKNMATSGSLDQTDSNTGTLVIGPAGSANVQDVELVVGVLTVNDIAVAATGNATNFSAQTNNWTELTDYGINGGVTDLTFATYEKITSAVETSTTTVTSSGTGKTSTMATFKGVAGRTDGWYMHAVDDNTDSYDIYYVDRTNPGAGTHTLLEAVATTTRTSPVAFTSGLGKLFYTNEQWSNPRSWAADALATPAAVTGVIGGRCIAFHKNRLFVAGGQSAPSRLYYSDIGDSSTWQATSYIDVSKDDGEAIEDITPFQDSLIIGKQTGLWILYGSGHDTFTLRKLPVGGIAPGRTLMPTPYGCIAAGRKHVWLIEGEQVSPLSRPIRSSYGMTGNFMTTSFIEDVCYIADSATGNVWAINLSTGTWWEERMSSNEGPSIVFNHDYNQLMSPVNASVGSSLNYRQFPGSSRGKDFDTLSTVYSMYTPAYCPVGPEFRFTPLHLFLRVRQKGAGVTETGLTVTPVYNGTAGTPKTFGPETNAGVYRYRFDLGDKQGIDTVQFYFDQTLPSTQDTSYDIEEGTLGFNIEKVR